MKNKILLFSLGCVGFWAFFNVNFSKLNAASNIDDNHKIDKEVTGSVCGHNHETEDTEESGCGCGHDHETEDAEESGCGCGHDHETEDAEESGCGCGHDHETEDAEESGCGCGHDHETEKAEETGCGHDHSHDMPVISQEALKNYKVVFDKLKVGSYLRRSPIQAQIIPIDGSEKKYSMIFGGIIKKIDVVPGDQLVQGQGMIKVLRNPIARPELVIVKDFIYPEVANLLEKSTSFAVITQQLAAAKAELARLEAAQVEDDLGALIPRKEMIAIKNTIQELSVNQKGIYSLLTRLGFNDDEIEQISQGKIIYSNYKQWKKALENNQYWNKIAEEIYGMLPKKLQKDYWAIASLGELVAQNRLNHQILVVLQNNVGMIKNWNDIASLLLEGHHIQAIRNWYQLGWLNQEVELLSLNNNSVVSALNVSEGQNLDAGTEILTLQDISKMQLAFSPIGSEYAWVKQAMTQKIKLTASPLIKEVGVELTDLTLKRIFVKDNQTEARIIVKNSFTKENMANLQAGMNYWVYLPNGKIEENVYVVNTSAITDLGSDKIIIVRHGVNYEQRKVVILFQDQDKTILSVKDSNIKPGEEYATTGAYRLNLAIQVGQGSLNTDPHAGCSH